MRRHPALAGGLAGLAIVAGLAIGLWRSSARPLPPGPEPRCPTVDEGCRPVGRPGGVLAARGGRYRLGQPGDVTVLGRWTCATTALPALLRPSTGQVWVFDRWAQPGQQVTARLVATVTGARSLQVAPGTRGCDGLLVQRQSGAPVRVRMSGS